MYHIASNQVKSQLKSKNSFNQLVKNNLSIRLSIVSLDRKNDISQKSVTDDENVYSDAVRSVINTKYHSNNNSLIQTQYTIASDTLLRTV
jgi:hypothetical protein